jgi:peptidoglycan/LPS O-acetylase OafA/YrhL
MDLLVRLFRRETTSKEFFPVIDGLRFLALFMVLMFHMDGYIKDKSSAMTFSQYDETFAQIPDVFIYMSQGVELFFIISGFILAMPFLKYAFGLSEKKPGLKAYYLRRLTRIEPLYIVTTILFFVLLAATLSQKHSLYILIVSLFSSLFYIHSVVFPGVTPFINSVTWSLEIEVQFYILAPFIVLLLCRLKNKNIRRLLNVTLIIAFAALSWLEEYYWQITTANITFYFHFFLAGILFCDIFLLDSKFLKNFDNLWVFILGLLLLVLITCTNLTYSYNIFLRIMSPLSIMLFYLIVCSNRWWSKIFSLNGLTLIGGMCYSIYLIHNITISVIGRVFINRFYNSNFAVYYWTQVFLLLFTVLFISSFFFLLVEKPCMKQDWHLRFFKKLKAAGLFVSDTLVKNSLNKYYYSYDRSSAGRRR